MKRFIYVSMIALFSMLGCDKIEKPTLGKQICAHWRGSELSVDAGIYIIFAADGTFELFQKMESDEYELRRGTWTLSGNILSGKYNDGEDWACSYAVTIEGRQMTLVAQNESAETNTYLIGEIPEHIRENSTIVVKSR